MQSWGDSSRYKQRTTGQVPTKSGIIGLLAAAEGRRRTDAVEDLAELTLAVRVDQPGSLLRDYQTAQAESAKHASLVTRYYLSDATFVAAVESPHREILDGLAASLRNPRYPLYLGRRSCPAPANLVLKVVDQSASEALRSEPWHASDFHKKARAKNVELPIYRDALPGETGVARQDVPVSFSQEHRIYSWREVILETPGVTLSNDLGTSVDPFFETVISA
ncbi:CRISPR system Cascade subunit CasD [Corynebacterium atrinae]|nr:CRISPR system Cascade subunit CasD [Corynebacterium atrinae]